MCQLILGSKSPRRRKLLKLLGHPFQTAVSQIVEDRVEGESPSEHVTRLSEQKARDVGSRFKTGIVIGSDTVVVLDQKILGKPATPADAEEMLLQLQGRTHTVYTGFALYDTQDDRSISGYESTEVTIRKLDKEQIRQYVETGEPLDKAGSYGIQGYGSALVTSIKGCYFTVMGLPLSKLMKELYSFSNGRYRYFGTRMESNK